MLHNQSILRTILEKLSTNPWFSQVRFSVARELSQILSQDNRDREVIGAWKYKIALLEKESHRVFTFGFKNINQDTLQDTISYENISTYYKEGLTDFPNVSLVDRVDHEQYAHISVGIQKFAPVDPQWWEIHFTDRALVTQFLWKTIWHHTWNHAKTKNSIDTIDLCSQKASLQTEITKLEAINTPYTDELQTFHEVLSMLETYMSQHQLHSYKYIPWICHNDLTYDNVRWWLKKKRERIVSIIDRDAVSLWDPNGDIYAIQSLAFSLATYKMSISSINTFNILCSYLESGLNTLAQQTFTNTQRHLDHTRENAYFEKLWKVVCCIKCIEISLYCIQQLQHFTWDEQQSAVYQMYRNALLWWMIEISLLSDTLESIIKNPNSTLLPRILFFIQTKEQYRNLVKLFLQPSWISLAYSLPESLWWMSKFTDIQYATQTFLPYKWKDTSIQNIIPSPWMLPKIVKKIRSDWKKITLTELQTIAEENEAEWWAYRNKNYLHTLVYMTDQIYQTFLSAYLAWPSAYSELSEVKYWLLPLSQKGYGFLWEHWHSEQIKIQEVIDYMRVKEHAVWLLSVVRLLWRALSQAELKKCLAVISSLSENNIRDLDSVLSQFNSLAETFLPWVWETYQWTVYSTVDYGIFITVQWVSWLLKRNNIQLWPDQTLESWKDKYTVWAPITVTVQNKFKQQNKRKVFRKWTG